MQTEHVTTFPPVTCNLYWNVADMLFKNVSCHRILGSSMMNTGQNRPAKVNVSLALQLIKSRTETGSPAIQPSTLSRITVNLFSMDNDRRTLASTTLPVCCYNTVPKFQVHSIDRTCPRRTYCLSERTMNLGYEPLSC